MRKQNNIPSREIVEEMKRRYPAGARVELVHMNDSYTTLKPGDRGTVTYVDDIGTAHIAWDNGSSLGSAYGVDVVKVIQNEV